MTGVTLDSHTPEVWQILQKFYVWLQVLAVVFLILRFSFRFILFLGYGIKIPQPNHPSNAQFRPVNVRRPNIQPALANERKARCRRKSNDRTTQRKPVWLPFKPRLR